MKKNKILIVSHVLNRSGAPTSLLKIVEKLAVDYELSVLSYAGGELEDQYRQFSKNTYISTTIQNTLKSKIKVFFNVLRFIYSEKPDIVFINTSVSNMTLVISWLLRIKIIVYVRESEKMLKSHIKKYFLNIADQIIAVSYETKEWIKKYVNEKKICVVHNGIDFEEDIKYQLEKKEFSKNYTISIIGYMCTRKGSDFFLEMILKLTQKINNVDFMIIGDFIDDSEKKHFLEVIKNNGLEDKLKITGIVENVYEYIYNSDIVTMMSREEALPRTVMESSFMKKPIVAFDTAGTKEMLPSMEFIIPQYDMNEFVQKVLYIIDNKLFAKIGADNYEYIKENFNLQNQIIKIKNIIKEFEGIQ